MDYNNGGQLGGDPSRQTAAEIARKKVLAAYSGASQNSSQAQTVTNSTQSRIVLGANRFQDNTAHLKDTPISTTQTSQINSESWKRYHSAWQNYYQKYYSEYYSNAARNYIAQEKLKAEREKAEEDEIAFALASVGGKKTTASGLSLNEENEEEADDIKNRLRSKIRRKASDNAKKTRKFRKFTPILVGAIVTLTILFLQYNRLIFAPIMAYVSPGNAPAGQIESLDPTITTTVSSDPRLIIPKLNVDVPIRFGVALDDVMESMNNGVTHYRIAGASAYPGQVGNFVITGHSAGDVYNSNPYKYIFSGLERLEDGDLIYVNYESVRYTYRVVKKEVIEPTNVAALVVQTDKPLITLVTCTPLGTSRYRLLVTGEQISPAYANEGESGTPSEDPTENIDENTSMPANEPTFFENIWNFLTGN